MATIRKRGKSWQAQVRLANCPPTKIPSKEAAKQWARIITHQLFNDAQTPPESRHTLASVLELLS